MTDKIQYNPIKSNKRETVYFVSMCVSFAVASSLPEPQKAVHIPQSINKQ